MGEEGKVKGNVPVLDPLIYMFYCVNDYISLLLSNIIILLIIPFHPQQFFFPALTLPKLIKMTHFLNSKNLFLQQRAHRWTNFQFYFCVIFPRSIE
jgi:hypothetical protein